MLFDFLSRDVLTCLDVYWFTSVDRLLLQSALEGWPIYLAFFRQPAVTKSAMDVRRVSSLAWVLDEQPSALLDQWCIPRMYWTDTELPNHPWHMTYARELVLDVFSPLTFTSPAVSVMQIRTTTPVWTTYPWVNVHTLRLCVSPMRGTLKLSWFPNLRTLVYGQVDLVVEDWIAPKLESLEVHPGGPSPPPEADFPHLRKLKQFTTVDETFLHRHANRLEEWLVFINIPLPPITFPRLREFRGFLKHFPQPSLFPSLSRCALFGGLDEWMVAKPVLTPLGSSLSLYFYSYASFETIREAAPPPIIISREYPMW